MSHILLLEDDETLAETLIDLLRCEQLQVTWAKTGEIALEQTYNEVFNLYIFDVNVPGLNGFELLKALRDAGDMTPAIFLTALSDIASLSEGFEVGADDYIKKPFDFDELLIRITALLRKSFQTSQNIIRLQNFEFHIDSNELFKNHNVVNLTPYEFKICKLFFMHRGHTVTKELLLEAVSDGGEASEGALRVYINKLRKTGLNISNIKGIGYRLETS